MEKKITLLLILFCFLSGVVNAQEKTNFIPPPCTTPNQNIEGLDSCINAIKICDNYYRFCTDRLDCDLLPAVLYFKLSIGDIYPGTTAEHISIETANSGNYSIFGPFNVTSCTPFCQQISADSVNTESGELSNFTSIDHLQAGFYILKLVFTQCVSLDTLDYTPYRGIKFNISSKAITCKERPNCTPPCTDCISSFSPEPGEYIISAWTRGDYENRNQQGGYSHPEIKVSFPNQSIHYNFSPKGRVIDGWQKITGRITVPTNATNIKISLKCTSGDCFFDDIRFSPVDASMVSYVYDPITLKMVAKLDPRNYATFYEYNEQGKLIRVKKETERGIMTIKENRNNIQK